MQIQNNRQSLSFGTKLKTAQILEASTMKIFYSEGISGFKEITDKLSEKPIRATGFRGYKYFAENFAKQIIEKYPQLKAATEETRSIIESNPHAGKKALYEKIKPVIDRIGEEFDIVL